jgi:hypothetical protein
METNFIEHSLEAIDSLLKLGGHLSVPFKLELLDWYAPNGLSLFYMGKKYCVSCFECDIKEEYEDLATALQRFEHFLHPRNNVGVALHLILGEHKFNSEIDCPPVTREIRGLLEQEKYNW